MEMLQAFWEQAVKLWNSMPPELQGIIVGIFLIAILIAILPRGYRTMQLVLPAGWQGKMTSTNNLNLENMPDEFTLNVNHEGIPEIPDTITIRVEHIGPGRDPDADDDEPEDDVEARDIQPDDMLKILSIIDVHKLYLKGIHDTDDADEDTKFLIGIEDLERQLHDFRRRLTAR